MKNLLDGVKKQLLEHRRNMHKIDRLTIPQARVFEKREAYLLGARWALKEAIKLAKTAEDEKHITVKWHPMADRVIIKQTMHDGTPSGKLVALKKIETGDWLKGGKSNE